MRPEEKCVSRETGELEEEWRPVVGWEGLYEVSSLGNVRSQRGMMKQKKAWNGRCEISLSRNGVKKSVLVHRMVARAFLGDSSSKPCVNHLDGNPLNNHVSNLEWCTYSENDEHARRNGLMGGERGNTTKLTTKQVRELRVRFDGGESPTKLAAEYGIKRGNVYKIGNRKTWRYV